MGSQVQVVWTPSHLNVMGNGKADGLAEEGRLQHPNNEKQRSEEPPQVEQVWEQIGPQPMRSDVSSSVGTAGSESSEFLLWVGRGNSAGTASTALQRFCVNSNPSSNDKIFAAMHPSMVAFSSGELQGHGVRVLVSVRM